MTGPEEAVLRIRQLNAVSTVERLDILGVLKLYGDQSTAEIGRRVPEARGGLQRTLKELADTGWVEQLEGSGRNARWRLADAQVIWSGIDRSDPDVQIAVRRVDQASSQRRYANMMAFEREVHQQEWSEEWNDVAVSRDYLERFTKEEVAELEDRLVDVIDSARAAARRRREDEGEAEEDVVFLTMTAFPRKI